MADSRCRGRDCMILEDTELYLCDIELKTVKYWSQFGKKGVFRFDWGNVLEGSSHPRQNPYQQDSISHFQSKKQVWKPPGKARDRWESLKSGVAGSSPRKPSRLEPGPTLVSNPMVNTNRIPLAKSVTDPPSPIPQKASVPKSALTGWVFFLLPVLKQIPWTPMWCVIIFPFSFLSDISFFFCFEIKDQKKVTQHFQQKCTKTYLFFGCDDISPTQNRHKCSIKSQRFVCGSAPFCP